MSRTTKHTGAIKTLQFNHTRNELLATAGAKGELYISDLNNIANPFRLGASAARADDYECLDWNKGEKVPHILATGSSGGFVTIWDVRAKKENLSLNNMGRKAVSAVSWDPTVATRLITAIPNDQDPLILVWDLRNSNAPERTLRGHELGVLSLDWCAHDPSLLLSCGKDNRTICWNPQTGEQYGDFSVVTNWTFQTRWNPHNPDLFATASFDGRISVQTTQNTNPQSQEQTAPVQAADGEDFFAQTQARPQGPAFSLTTAPKWRKAPVGASFGFGGKLVRFKADAATRKSTVTLDTFVIDSAVPEAAEKFEEALKGGDLASLCEKKISEASNDEEKADWQVIETLNAGKSRKKLREYLGFGDDLEDLSKKTDGLALDGDAETQPQAGGAKDESSFFEESADGDNFLADLAATKGAKTNEPFHIHSESESQADKEVTSALILGNFEKALDICLKDDRMSDAFMIAICGGQACIDKVQRAYLKQKARGPSYLRLLASIVGKNLWDVVHNADLANWRQVMATLCTFADEGEFSDLCEALGDRLEEALNDGKEKGTLRRDASFCYLAGSKLEKVVMIWTEELQEKEAAALQGAETESGFSVHARSLQEFVEKVTVFRHVTNFQDADKQSTADWKLAPLYAKYTEYADILASHGQLQVAEKYLDLLPSKYPLAEVAQQRIKKATGRSVVPAAAKVPATSRMPAAAATRPGVPAYGLPTPAPMVPLTPQMGASQYNPPQMGTPAPIKPSPYAPTNNFTPSGYQPPGQQPYGMNYQTLQSAALVPPPRAGAATPSGPPPPPKANGANWNDLPETFAKPPTASRRNTPGPSMLASPFPNAPNMMSPTGPPPPGASPYNQPKSAVAPLPPPPKAGEAAASRVTSPITSAPPPRPISRTTSAYAPPQMPSSNAYAPPTQAAQPAPGLAPQTGPPSARGPSPYNAPATAAPPSNRYAPAPGSMSSPAPSMGMPQRNVAPPPNPYGAAPSPYGTGPRPGQPPMGSMAAQPPQATAPPPQGPPRAGPPPGGPPRNATPSAQPSAPPQPAAPAAQPAQKFPPGDRSHIPGEAMPIVEILSADMARVKSRAPASFERQVNDVEKRLNILFDHLNNQDLLKPDTVQELLQISQCVQSRDMAQAEELLMQTMKLKLETEGGNWMVSAR